MSGRLAAWWQARSARERRLVGALALALVAGGITRLGQLIARDVGALRTAIVDGERRLVVARGLAGRLEASALAPDDAGMPPLVSVVEVAVTGLVGAERLTRLEPGDDPERSTEARLIDLDLGDVVRVLAALESPDPRVRVRDLELRRRPDAPGRYDATAVVIRHGAP